MPLSLFLNYLDEDNRQFEQAGHGNTQEDGAVEVRTWRQEGRGNPHTNV